MSEMGVNIREHKTADIADLDLASFDLIVVFRPSAAESMSFPAAARLVYLDVSDPYGGSLDDYRTTARFIQRGVRRLYVKDALSRMSSTVNATGSHAAGVFNRAAKQFEKETAEFVTQQLCLSPHRKATLGQLCKLIADYSISHNLPELKALAETIAEVNDIWVDLKHGQDPPADDVVSGLERIQRGFHLLNSRTA
jgi:hypothetical protein